MVVEALTGLGEELERGFEIDRKARIWARVSRKQMVKRRWLTGVWKVIYGALLLIIQRLGHCGSLGLSFGTTLPFMCLLGRLRSRWYMGGNLLHC